MSATASSSSKKIAVTALFTAASLVLSFIQIPIFPAAPWLMYDPSAIVCLVAALVFGPRLGCAVAVISWLPRLFLDPFGAPMGMLSTCAFIIPAGVVFVRDRTREGGLLGMAIGAVLSVALACLANLYVTPLYTAVTIQDVALMIAPILLPFNALKMVINVAATQALFSPVMRLAEAQGLVPAQSEKHPDARAAGDTA